MVQPGPLGLWEGLQLTRLPSGGLNHRLCTKTRRHLRMEQLLGDLRRAHQSGATCRRMNETAEREVNVKAPRVKPGGAKTACICEFFFRGATHTLRCSGHERL